MTTHMYQRDQRQIFLYFPRRSLLCLFQARMGYTVQYLKVLLHKEHRLPLSMVRLQSFLHTHGTRPNVHCLTLNMVQYKIWGCLLPSTILAPSCLSSTHV